MEGEVSWCYAALEKKDSVTALLQWVPQQELHQSGQTCSSQVLCWVQRVRASSQYQCLLQGAEESVVAVLGANWSSQQPSSAQAPSCLLLS